MGIPISALKAMRDALPARRVLMLGFQDLLIGIDELEAEFPMVDWPNPVFNQKSQEWHDLDFTPVDSAWCFARLGTEQLSITDKFKWRGDEIEADLNCPSELGQHDLVIDAGTIEHCMNIGQALMNTANAVAVGGHVFHCSPLNMMNHGFYNINPTLFHDFYIGNGWDIKSIFAANGNGWMDVPDTGRFGLPEKAGELSMHVLVKRLTDKAPQWQTQTKYVKMQARAA